MLLLRHKPHILQISGQSRRSEGFILEDHNGQVMKIDCSQLVDLITSLSDGTLCLVFFSFCYSEACATAISKRIPYSIGVIGEVPSNSFVVFSHAFHHALASDSSVRSAVDYACQVLKTEGSSGSDAMVLRVQSGINSEVPFLESLSPKQIRGPLKLGLPPFESELLLQQAIAELLSRIKTVRDVQILQGAQEYGKDLVFHTSGPLGEPLACACVIKNLKISGAVGKGRGARTVFEQVEQALDTAFLNGSGEEVRAHRVYVISPAEMTQIALNSIKGKLASRSGQVVFMGSNQLFRLFRQHWPEFLGATNELT